MNADTQLLNHGTPAVVQEDTSEVPPTDWYCIGVPLKQKIVCLVICVYLRSGTREAGVLRLMLLLYPTR